MPHSEIIPNVSFDDIWNRLADSEEYVCCTRGTGSGWETFIAWNPRERYISNGEGSLFAIKGFVRKEQELGRRTFGYISYGFGLKLQTLKPRAKNDINLPEALLYSYDAYIVCRENEIEICANDLALLAAFSNSVKEILARAPAKVSRTVESPDMPEFKPDTTEEAYAQSYESVKQHIIAGDIYQMNLTHRLGGRTKKSPRELWSAMWDKNQADFSAYIEGDGFEILSASPERFISVSASHQIDTFPIKGTRPRGANPAEDERLKNELINSEKETAELTMITDLLRNDMGKVCEFGSVRVVSTSIVRAFASVWHAYSHVTGVCAKGLDSIDALLSMFPGGSVTGCPKRRAMEIINELEPTARGVYAGSIGYINPDDSADFNIAIRTLIKKGDKVYLQVGGGIVYDSNEKDEYKETLDKAKSFLGIL
ncbi:MAG: anthranilate synthase component I family protein [bacterium]|nr:anthranilate synthase component I family protein [bacterium]